LKTSTRSYLTLSYTRVDSRKMLTSITKPNWDTTCSQICVGNKQEITAKVTLRKINRTGKSRCARLSRLRPAYIDSYLNFISSFPSFLKFRHRIRSIKNGSRANKIVKTQIRIELSR